MLYQFFLVICSLIAFGANSVAFANDGMQIYQTRCSICHGKKGDGHGSASASLNPKPTDFTLGLYKYRSTPWGTPPLDSDLKRTIHDGLQGTAMPAWGDILSSEESDAVILVLRGFAPSAISGMPPPLPVPSFQSASVETGKELYQEKGCALCHGAEGHGDGIMSIHLKNKQGEPIRPRDLTDFRNYRWGATLKEIYFRIATGLNGTPMEGYADRMTSNEIVHLSSYLKSLYEKAEKIRWVKTNPDPDLLHRGDYLTRAMTCQLCHTPFNTDLSYREKVRFSGGIKVSSFPDGIYYSRNITPDIESGLGEWSVAEIQQALTRGISKNGRLLYPFDMPWIFFSNLTDLDAKAIAIYLKSLDPIYNKVPPPKPEPFITSFWNKTQLLFGRETTLEYHEGNAGEANRERGEGIPNATAGYFSLLPPMGGLIPVKKVLEATRVVTDLPAPAPTKSAIEDVKRLRGQYLVSIAPCALCHTATRGSLLPKASPALSGGMKISCGKSSSLPSCFGTVYSRNLTSDSETGLGDWTDQQIRRAIKSGITKDGRMMHFQAMPWDMFSNFTEADLEAIIAYLRGLSPVKKRIPPPTPEAPPGYVIYMGKDYGTSVEKIPRS